MKNNPLVSIIIPTKNSEEFIEGCLRSVTSQTYKNIEVIVVDNSSMDRTKGIIKNLQKSKINNQKSVISLYNKGPERSAQRNFGAKKARGEYLLFIDSDMELSDKVVEDCVRLVKSYKVHNVHKVLGGIIIPEKSVGDSFWAKCKAVERSFYEGVDWIEAARFFPKKIFEEFKGYDENQTGTEDYDLPQKIKEKYGKDSIIRIKNYIIHQEGKLSLFDALKKKFYYAKTLSRYKNTKSNQEYFRKQASIIERYKLFFLNPKKLFSDPLVGFGTLFMKTVELGVMGIGYLVSEIFKR
ncbi:MAG: glycosyltransferase family 2 protein [Candidatus Pacearchaeota archaeon]